jgi:hypothetical protein
MKRITYFDLLSKSSPAHSLLRVAEGNRLFTTCPRKAQHELDPSVRALADFVKRPENDFLRVYIGSMLDEANQ